MIRGAPLTPVNVTWDAAAAATVNVELASLHKALKVAQEIDKLAAGPTIRTLKPAAPRSGFLERHEVEAICSYLPDELQLVVMVGYTFGWRVKSEVLTLTKWQVDFEAGTLRLEPGTTKNDDGRIVYLTPELKAGLIDQLAKVRVLARDMSCVIPYLFPHFTGMYRGKRRLGMREVCNRVAMMITGHRTHAVFERYHIIGPQDLCEASKKIAGSDTRHTIRAQDGV
jgi:integrase